MLRLAITYDTAKNGGSAWHSLRSCQFKKLGEVLGTRRWLVPIQETRHKAWYFAVAHTTAQTSARLACSFLYPFQRLRKRKLNGVVLTTFVPIQETRHKACAVLYAGIAAIAFCKGYACI